MADSSPKKTSGLAIAGLVLGILAIATSFLPIINNLSAIIAVVGGILALVALIGAFKGKNDSKGIAIAGVVLAIVSFVIVLATQSMYASAIDSAVEEVKNGSQPVSADGAAAEGESSGESEDADYAHMSVGQSVTLGNGLQISVNSVETGLVNYDGSTVIGVNVTYTNTGSKSQSFNVFDWKSETANGVQTSYTYYSEGQDELSSGTLAAGGTVTGNLYFEDDAVRVLYFSSLIADSESIGWDIA